MVPKFRLEVLGWRIESPAKEIKEHCTPQSMECSLPGFSISGMFQARILEWVAMSSSRRSSPPKDKTHTFYVSCIGRWVLYQ